MYWCTVEGLSLRINPDASDTLQESVHWIGQSKSNSAMLYTPFQGSMKNDISNFNTLFEVYRTTVHLAQHCVHIF